MKKRPTRDQKHFVVQIRLLGGKIIPVNAKASTLEVAEARALKRTTGAVEVVREGS